MQAMDVFVFPSKYEGFPVTIVEAQASGLPCLISDKVPIDCKITDHVWQISLNSSVLLWKEKVLELDNFSRIDNLQIIKENNFDIEENANKLLKFYFEF